MCSACCVHVQWLYMLKVENCTNGLVVNLSFAVLLR